MLLLQEEKIKYKKMVEMLNQEMIGVTANGHFVLGIAQNTDIASMRTRVEQHIEKPQEDIDQALQVMIKYLMYQNMEKMVALEDYVKKLRYDINVQNLEYAEAMKVFADHKTNGTQTESMYKDYKTKFKAWIKWCKEVFPKKENGVLHKKLFELYKQSVATIDPDFVEEVIKFVQNKSYILLLQKEKEYEKEYSLLADSQLLKTTIEQSSLEKLQNSLLDIYIRIDKGMSVEKLQEVYQFLQHLPSIVAPKIQFNILDAHLTRKEAQFITDIQQLQENKKWPSIKITDPELIHNLEGIHIEQEYKEGWKPETLQYANEKIKDFVKRIKQAGLSPMEAAISIHEYVSGIKEYKRESEKRIFANQASFVEAYQKNGNIVCAGFSALFKACVDELNMPGLRCEEFTCKIYQERTNIVDENKNQKYDESFHSQIIVHLDDQKYHIQGDFLNETTWDNRQDDELPMYSNCLLPIEALYHYSKGVIQPSLIVNKTLTRGRKITKEHYVENRIAQHPIPQVENGIKTKIPQKTMEKAIFTMYQKMVPQATKEELIQVIKGIAEESWSNVVSIWQENYVVFKEPTTQLTKAEMNQLFESNQQEQYVRNKWKDVSLSSSAYYHEEIER